VKLATRIAALGLTAFASLLPPAFAAPGTLVGDTLTVIRVFPDASTPYTAWDPYSVSIMVAPDGSDTFDWQVSGFQTIINPGVDSIEFGFPVASRFDTDAITFDGFTISGFSNSLASASILSNTTGLTAVVSLVGQELQLSLAGANLGDTTGLTVGVTFAAAVPEPGTWSLFLSGIAAVAAFSFRRKRLTMSERADR